MLVRILKRVLLLVLFIQTAGCAYTLTGDVEKLGQCIVGESQESYSIGNRGRGLGSSEECVGYFSYADKVYLANLPRASAPGKQECTSDVMGKTVVIGTKNGNTIISNLAISREYYARLRGNDGDFSSLPDNIRFECLFQGKNISGSALRTQVFEPLTFKCRERIFEPFRFIYGDLHKALSGMCVAAYQRLND